MSVEFQCLLASANMIQIALCFVSWPCGQQDTDWTEVLVEYLSTAKMEKNV